jgi:hypothetical protein
MRLMSAPVNGKDPVLMTGGVALIPLIVKTAH